jgi:inner membrane protein involved in colicin E2 resistance
MNDIPIQSGLQSAIRSRSMGAKLIVVCGLSLAMTIPAFLVGGLVTERTVRAANGNKDAHAQVSGHATLLGISSVQLTDSYQSVNRALKYTQLFVGLVFLSYFMFEISTGRRVHPAQYVLVGIAQIIFYLLLLSLAEQMGFDIAYSLAGGATIGLLAWNALWVFKSQRQGLRALVVFTLLYALIYVLLRLEAYALLVGAISSFAAVAGAMYLTRNIDWYASGQGAAAPLRPASGASFNEESFRIND